jgi:chemotaxis protein methyltransferase CheR
MDPTVRHRALGLLRDDRFAEALAVVEGGMTRRPVPPDLLLHGMLLAQVGRLDAAEAVSRQLLDVDGLYADAHHLLGVCCEGAADVPGAIGHYRLAAYLDPHFAMPRLRLGQLDGRAGNHGGTDLEPALMLLPQESDERIALFGGGFGRISLVSLCRAELHACEVRR